MAKGRSGKGRAAAVLLAAAVFLPAISASKGASCTLAFQLVDQTMTGADALLRGAPQGTEILYSHEEIPQPYLVGEAVLLGSEHITEAGWDLDINNGSPIVTFRFDEVGTAAFAKLTRANIGRSLAVVFGDVVLSAPAIREAITGGSGQIAGNFTLETAERLAELIRDSAGAAPAPGKGAATCSL